MSTDHEPPPVAGPQDSPAGTTPRGNAMWVDADYVVLVEGLRAGLDQVAIAQRLGRTTGGLRRRMAWLLPPGVELPRAEVEDWLRETLRENAAYDWRAALRWHHERDNRPYFDHQADELLRQAWSTRRAMPQVAADLGADEFTIARQLIALGMASTLIEVAGRLGASPGSVLDVRVRLATERLGAAVWILIVDGLAADRHVSVHDTDDDAQAEVDRLLKRHIHPDATVSQVTWTIAHRAVAGGSTGQTRHDKLLPLPQVRAGADDAAQVEPS